MTHVQVKDLSVVYRDDAGTEHRAVANAGLTLERGGTLGIVGESGSGKSTLARTLLGYVRPGARVAGGSVSIGGTDVFGLSGQALQQFRGGRAAMVPQNPLSALTAHLSVGDQLSELVRRHTDLRGAAARDRVLSMMDRTGLPDPAALARRYPHELSGGQRQRVVIAAALIGEPEVLVLDEPTTALDKSVEARVLQLIADIQHSTGATLIYVSHDLNVIRSLCAEIIVMKGGAIVETGKTRQVFHTPAAAYTRKLIQAIPRLDAKGPRPPARAEPDFLRIAGLDFTYSQPRRLFSRAAPPRKALDGLHLSVARGETLGVVGESGSGKSTLAGVLSGLLAGHRGEMTLAGTPVSGPAHKRSRQDRKRIQLVFQDPLAALNPTRTIGDILVRPLQLHRDLSRAAAREEALLLMDRMALAPDLFDRRPRQLSGGQQQRVGLARALAAEPELIICDEVTSALDVTIQAQVLDLFLGIQAESGMTCIFISHDLGVVARVSHKIAVMKNGALREVAPRDRLLHDPRDAYSAELIRANRADISLPALEIA